MCRRLKVYNLFELLNNKCDNVLMRTVLAKRVSEKEGLQLEAVIFSLLHSASCCLQSVVLL